MKDVADKKNILEKKISENCMYYCFVDGFTARKGATSTLEIIYNFSQYCS